MENIHKRADDQGEPSDPDAKKALKIEIGVVNKK
jgi:hypothetical protein